MRTLPEKLDRGSARTLLSTQQRRRKKTPQHGWIQNPEDDFEIWFVQDEISDTSKLFP